MSRKCQKDQGGSVAEQRELNVRITEFQKWHQILYFC